MDKHSYIQRQLTKGGDRKLEIGQLVDRAISGDREALLSLIMDKKDDFYRLAYVYTMDREDAMDAVEDMILIVYRQIKMLRDSSAFYSWSKTILVNCCRDILRKRKKSIAMDDIDDTAFEGDYEKGERRADILMYIKKLGNHQQEVIKLKYLMDMDYEAISIITNVPVGTVKSRAAAGLKKLRELLGGEY